MAFRDAASIFKSLRDGTVPQAGLEAFAVGIEHHRKELQRKLVEVETGEGGVKFLRGGYGCGKTFMARLVVGDALLEFLVQAPEPGLGALLAVDVEAGHDAAHHPPGPVADGRRDQAHPGFALTSNSACSAAPRTTRDKGYSPGSTGRPSGWRATHSR